MSCLRQACGPFASAAAPTVQITHKQWGCCCCFLFFGFKVQLYVLRAVLAPLLALEGQQWGLADSRCLPGTGAEGVGSFLSLSSASPPSGTPAGRDANLRSQESLGRLWVGSSHHSGQSTQEWLLETLGSGTQAGQPDLLECSHAAPGSTLLWPPSMSPNYVSLPKRHHKGCIQNTAFEGLLNVWTCEE